MTSTNKSGLPRKTGKWLRPDAPHTGWRCIDVNDDGAICEMCEVANIVYVHVMQHDNYPVPLWVGSDCAGYMVEDPAVEQLRGVLYKWQRVLLAARTPIEKLRRNRWHRSKYVHGGHVFGFQFRRGRFYDIHFDYCVEISNTDGWRHHLYFCNPRSTWCRNDVERQRGNADGIRRSSGTRCPTKTDPLEVFWGAFRSRLIPIGGGLERARK
jgi:hypothetical protein